MWKYTGGEGGSDFIPGVPPCDMTDPEFDVVSDEVDKQYPDQPGSLKRSGLYKHVKDSAPEPTAKSEAPKEE